MTLWHMGQDRRTGDQWEHTTLFFTSRKAHTGLDSTRPPLLEFILLKQTRAFETVVCRGSSGLPVGSSFALSSLFDGSTDAWHLDGRVSLYQTMSRFLSFTSGLLSER